MRRFSVVASFLILAFVGLTGAIPGQAQTLRQGGRTVYLVLYRDGEPLSSARAAVKAIGGTILEENRAVGLAKVATTNADFLDAVRGQKALKGAARNVSIGRAPALAHPARWYVEHDRTLGASSQPAAPGKALTNVDPLSGLQWDMGMIHADAAGSYAVQQGDPGVIVAIIDTGIDGTHPDIAPNFDEALSRNWTKDIEAVDGPCEHPTCVDPPNEDDGGHGTHVAGTVAAALNGLGTAGVAPKVTLVNDRAGQDSGFFFLMETVNALTYAGDIGADVANMSFFTDPWLFNCLSNPKDSPASQMEQATIISATQKALKYAHDRGVTLVAAEGNENTDLGNPVNDNISPDYPDGAAYHRHVTNKCLTMPTEGNFVIAVSALGSTGRKAYYSNYGVEQTNVSAPGGDRREFFGTPQYDAVENRQLSTMPQNVAIAEGDLNPDGSPNTRFVVRNCANGVCAYYQYLQGTSMASPHAVGVAALIVSEFGVADPAHGGLTMNPADVRARLYSTATPHACPHPRLFHYPDPDLGTTFDAYCDGTPSFNGFYGHGIVDALAAVS